MNINAMLKAVVIHEASSTDNPNAPRKSGRPTLRSFPVSVTIPAPSMTPSVPMYGLGFTFKAERWCDEA